MLDSVDTILEAKDLVRGLQQIYKATGMRLTKWLSNEAAALADTAEGEWAQDLRLATHEDPLNEAASKTLGVIYDAREDQFSFYKERPGIPDTELDEALMPQCMCQHLRPTWLRGALM